MRSYRLSFACLLACVFIMLGFAPPVLGSPLASPPPSGPAVSKVMSADTWFADAHATFRWQVGQLHSTVHDGKLLKAKMDKGTRTSMASNCAWLAGEYNKRAQAIPVGRTGVTKTVKDKDGDAKSFRPTEDYFEKRGLPRKLDGKLCQAPLS